MKVEQFAYLSAEASELRRRDGTPPWGVHVCEVDSLEDARERAGCFGDALREAIRLRDELELDESATSG